MTTLYFGWVTVLKNTKKMHIAFAAESCVQVDEFYKAVLQIVNSVLIVLIQ